MIDFLKIFNDLSNVENNTKVKKYDLQNMTDEEYEDLKNTINELKDNSLFNILGSFFDINNDTIDSLLDVADKYRKENKKETKFKRPSETIPTNIGLKLHKLVQEYVDTMITPYNPKNGGLTKEAINDAYAGLYEFICWIFQHK